MCSNIVQQNEWSKRRIFNERVGLALVGHPRVGWADGSGPAEVVRAEPTLVVEERQGKLTLTMLPAEILDGETIAYQRQGPRLLVYPLQPVHQKVVEIIGAGVAMPKASHALLQQTLGDLAALMPLQSKLAVKGGSAEAVEAETRPMVLLRRSKAGILVSVQVFPLGLAGPGFVPGEGPNNVASRLDGRSLSTARDRTVEKKLLRRLMTACPTLPADSIADEQEINDLISCYELLTELGRCEGSLVGVAWPEGQPLSIVAERDVRDLKLRFETGGDWFVARGSLEVDEELVLDLASLLKKASGGIGRFIELGDGKVLALSKRLMRQVEALSAHGRKRRKALELSPMSLFALEGWIDEGGAIKMDRGIKQQLSRLREAQVLSCALPKTLKAELRDYQREGFRWLCRLAHWGGGPVWLMTWAWARHCRCWRCC